MTQSEVLSRFYREYLAWVEAGALEHPVFDRNSGLCLTLERYAGDAHKKVYGDELEAHFVAEGVCDVFPFNGGYQYNNSDAMKHYIAECQTHTCHLNELRISWVRNHANQ